MADDQLRGLTLDNIIIGEASSMVPIPQEWRTDWENIDAPREFISVDYSNLEARWVLPEVMQSALTIETLRQESRRAMINNMFAMYGKIFPTPEKEKKQIKRGNPWAQ